MKEKVEKGRVELNLDPNTKAMLIQISKAFGVSVNSFMNIQIRQIIMKHKNAN